MMTRVQTGSRISLRLFAATAAALLLSACEQGGTGGVQQRPEAAAQTKAAPGAEAPAVDSNARKAARTPAGPADDALANAAPSARTVADQPAPTDSSETGAIGPADELDPFEQNKIMRRRAENLIYATIRIKMEEMIDRRAGLLKSGKDPSDVEIRQLEGSIMRARELLQEAGEIVEDVVPPIVQSRQTAGS